MSIVGINRGPDPWAKLGVNLVGGLLDNMIGGMMQRDAEARAQRRNQQFYSDFAQDMTPRKGMEYPEAPQNDYGAFNNAVQTSGITDQKPLSAEWAQTLGRDVTGSREDFVRALGRHGATPEQAAALSMMYENQFKQADDLRQGDLVRGRLDGLDFSRQNPGLLANVLAAQGYGLKPEEAMKYTHPNYTASNFDAGDRAVMYSFDPLTGTFNTQEARYGLNPTDKYQADADTKQANINAETERYVADRNYAGNVYVADTNAGSSKYVADKTYGGKQPGGAAKSLSIADKKNLDAMVANAIQLATSKEDFNSRLGAIAGSNAEAQEYAKFVAANPQYMLKNQYGMYETKANPWATSAGSPQTSGNAQPSGMQTQISQMLHANGGDATRTWQQIQALDWSADPSGLDRAKSALDAIVKANQSQRR